MSFPRGMLSISRKVREDRLKAPIYFLALLRAIRNCLAVCALLKLSAADLRKSFRIMDVERGGCGIEWLPARGGPSPYVGNGSNATRWCNGPPAAVVKAARRSRPSN